MNYSKTTSGFKLTDGPGTIRIVGARVRRYNWNIKEALEYRATITVEELERIVGIIDAEKLPDSSSGSR